MPQTDYVLDGDGNETYTTSQARDEVIENGRYAKNKDGHYFYPKDSSKNEFRDKNQHHIQRNGVYVLPLSNTGEPVYDVDANNNNKQLYPTYDGKFIFGVGLNGHQFYAKDENGHEYYPEDNTFAKKLDGTIFYAKKVNGNTVFPKDKDGNEYYLGSVDPNNIHTIPTTYAQKSNDDQFYPKTVTADGFESDYLLETYALLEDQTLLYPKDAFHNEFYLPQKTSTGATRAIGLILPATARYALTNDSKVILPDFGNTFHKDGNKQPVVSDTDVLGRLIREKRRASGYLTSLEGNHPQQPEPKEYKYIRLRHGAIETIRPAGSTPPKVVTGTHQCPSIAATSFVPLYKGWHFWLLVVVTLLLKGFAVWCFLLRNETFVK